ncbi:MAG: TIGR03435 family protein [Acidobacteriota bacterium]|nr:TIGR03435 family protein [Acidobacteriota bacterium]
MLLRRILLLLAAALGTSISAQPPVPQSPAPAQSAVAFDVASIKLNKALSGHLTISSPPDGDGITITKMSLQTMLMYAYSLQSKDYLQGAPDWAKSDQYDLQAKVADSDVAAYHNLNDAQRKLMLQALLTESFKMQIHSETKEIESYALVVGKGGPRIKEVKPGDANPDAPKKPDGTPVLGPVLFSASPDQIIGQEVPLSMLARAITAPAGRPVVDKTALTGIYDFTLKWAAERRSAAPSAEGTADASDTSGPSIFTAVEEQLGLKLEPQKETVPILRIDHAERPSPN